MFSNMTIDFPVHSHSPDGQRDLQEASLAQAPVDLFTQLTLPKMFKAQSFRKKRPGEAPLVEARNTAVIQSPVM